MFNPFTTEADDNSQELNEARPDATDGTDDARSPSSYRVIDRPADHRIDQVVELLADPADGVVTRAGAIARIKRQTRYEVQGFIEELDTLLRQRQTALIGVDHHTPMLRQLAERVGLTLAVAPHNEEHVGMLCRHLSALVADDRVSGLGSGRRFTIPVSTDAEAAESSRVLHALENHQGDPLHHLGNDDWDFVAVTAPEQWVETTEETLSAYAPVVDTVVWDRPRITVCGFVFVDDEPASGGGGSGRAVRTDGSDHASRHSAGSDGSRNGPVPTDSARGGPPDPAGGSGRPSGRGPSAGRESPAGRGDDDGTAPAAGDGSTTEADPGESSGSPPAGGGSEPDARSAPEGGDASAAPAGTDLSPTRLPASEANPESESEANPESEPESEANPESEQESEPASDANPESGTDPEADPEPKAAGSSPTEGSSSVPDPGSSEAPESGSGSGEAGSEPIEPAPDQDVDPTDGAAPAQPGGDAGHSPAGGHSADPTTDGGSAATGSVPPSGSVPESDTDGRGEASSDGAPMPPATGTPFEGSTTDDPAGDAADATDATGGADATGLPSTPGPCPPTSPDTSGTDGRPPRSGSGSSTIPPDATPETTPADGDASDPDHGATDGPAPSAEGMPSPPGGTGPGLVPAGDAPASRDPGVVDIDEHVLNEISSHAVAHDGEVGHGGQEVYATLYCNDDGVIRHSHIIEDETFLEKRRSSITFKPTFYRYVRHLAQIYRNISHRLCGDVHSHPGGIPKQSPADKAVSKTVWNNPRRNHNFIIGLDDADGDAPDRWTVVEDGVEVKKRVNGHLLRVRAFAGGTNEPKQIRVHTTMGV